MELHVITACTKSCGVVLVEVFDDLEKANDFMTNGVDAQLRKEYGDAMADDKTLSIGGWIKPPLAG